MALTQILRKHNDMVSNDSYLHTILQKSQKYLEQTFSESELLEFHARIKPLYALNDTKEIIKAYEKSYYEFVKECYQSHYKHDANLESFLQNKDSKKILWGGGIVCKA